MFNKKDLKVVSTEELSLNIHKLTIEQFKVLEEKFAHQATINSCLIKILEDINNHKREESILKKLDELKNYIDRIKK